MKPLCIAHRGCHWNCYENTIQSFHAAANGNFYGIELDVHLTKDKKWIIHHDPEFLSNGKKIIIKKEKFNYLTNLPLDNPKNYQAKCPSLDELFDALRHSDKKAIIEIKPKNPSFHNLKKLIKEIKKKFDLNRVVFIAFYPWPLIKLRILLKNHPVQLLVEKEHLFLLDWAYNLNWDIDVESSCMNERIVKRFHSKKLKVNTWTIDDKKDLQRLEKMGVDYITSNVFDQNS